LGLSEQFCRVGLWEGGGGRWGRVVCAACPRIGARMGMDGKEKNERGCGVKSFLEMRLVDSTRIPFFPFLITPSPPLIGAQNWPQTQIRELAPQSTLLAHKPRVFLSRRQDAVFLLAQLRGRRLLRRGGLELVAGHIRVEAVGPTTVGAADLQASFDLKRRVVMRWGGGLSNTVPPVLASPAATDRLTSSTHLARPADLAPAILQLPSRRGRDDA
jgi:hypothetical protein